MIVTDRNSKNINPAAQFGIFLGLIGFGLVIGFLISIAVWHAMTGRPLLSIETDMVNPKYYNAATAVQVITSVFMFFVPTYFFAIICYRKPAKFLGFNTNINYKQVLLVLGILALTFPLSGALIELNKIIPIPADLARRFKADEEKRALLEAALININSFPKYLLSLIVIGFLPGLVEEICFRAGLQNILTRWFKGPWVAIILTGILFSLVHYSYYGFLVRFALGVILGAIFYLSGNIWLSVLFHFLYNGLQVTVMYIATISASKNQTDIEGNFPWWAGVAALALIIYLFIQFEKVSVLRRFKIIENDFPDDEFHNWAAAQS